VDAKFNVEVQKRDSASLRLYASTLNFNLWLTITEDRESCLLLNRPLVGAAHL
jgi:hypothetical protein